MSAISARSCQTIPTLMSHSKLLTSALCAITTASASIALGAEPPHKETVPLQRDSATHDEKEKSALDRLWDLPTIYRNKESDWVNEVRFVGRFQLDQYNVDSDLGHDSDWLVRRLRLGVKAQLFHNLTAHVEVEIDPHNDNPAYRRLTDAYLSWKFCDAAKFTVGKQSVKFTLDGSTSSTELITIDRNNVANNFWFPAEYVPGVSLSGIIDQWSYNVGVFSGGSESPEFGNFDAGNFVLASLGYDFGKQLGVKKALLRADYIYNQRDAESTFTRSLENVGSLVFILDNKKWGVSADVNVASGYGKQGDLFGFDVMPWYNITDRLQAVARYTYIDGESPNSIRFSRYESFQTGGRGDEYSELYAGLNYYVYGHKLKLQTGFAYTTMHDSAHDGGQYAGWSWTTGLRVSW
jgi:phosphate-selective porin OprO/OprP